MKTTAGMSCRSRKRAVRQASSSWPWPARRSPCAHRPRSPARSQRAPPTRSQRSPLACRSHRRSRRLRGLRYPGRSRSIRKPPKRRPRSSGRISRGGRIVGNVVTPTLTPVSAGPGESYRCGGHRCTRRGLGGSWNGHCRFQRRAPLADRGIAAFVLKYRTAPTDRDPTKFFQYVYKSIADLAQDRIAGTHNAQFEGFLRPSRTPELRYAW